MTNKLDLVKIKEHKNTDKKKLNLIQTVGSPVRTAHMSVHITEYNCGTQYSTKQF